MGKCWSCLEITFVARSNSRCQSEEARVHLKDALYLSEFHRHLSLSLGSGQDKLSPCRSCAAPTLRKGVVARATHIPGHRATVSSV